MPHSDFQNLEAPQPGDGEIHPQRELRSRYGVRDGRIVVAMPTQALTGCLPIWILCVLGLIGLLIYIFVDSKGNWITVAVFGAVGTLILGVLYGAAEGLAEVCDYLKRLPPA